MCAENRTVPRAEEVKRRIRRDIKTFAVEFYGHLIESLVMLGLMITSNSSDQTRRAILAVSIFFEFMVKSVVQAYSCMDKIKAFIIKAK